jgi:hypothetical protein
MSARQTRESRAMIDFILIIARVRGNDLDGLLDPRENEMRRCRGIEREARQTLGKRIYLPRYDPKIPTNHLNQKNVYL